MMKTLIMAVLASVVAFSLGRMSLEHLRLYGLIVLIPVSIYCAYMVLSMAREELSA